MVDTENRVTAPGLRVFRLMSLLMKYQLLFDYSDLYRCPMICPDSFVCETIPNATRKIRNAKHGVGIIAINAIKI